MSGKVGSFAEQNKSIIDKLSSKNKTLMKKIPLLLIVLSMSTAMFGQVVTYGDSNYLFHHLPQNPPIFDDDYAKIYAIYHIYDCEDVRFVSEYGQMYAIDSLESIYGIAFVGDTLLQSRTHNQTVSATLRLYVKHAGANSLVPLDSIVMDVTMPHERKFVYQAVDSTTSTLLVDTVPVYERLFAFDWAVEPGDSIMISYKGAPKIKDNPPIRGDCILGFYQRLLRPGPDFRLLEMGPWGTYDCRRVDQPIFPIRHRACPRVESVRVDSVDGTRMWLSWSPVDTASRYRLEYGPEGFYYGGGVYSSGTVVEGITDTSYVVSGLLSNTVYTFHVSAYCPTMKQYGMAGYAMGLTNDVVYCPAAEGLRIEEKLSDGVRLVWDTMPEQTNFELYVRREGMEAIYLMPDSNPYELRGLDEEVAYNVALRAECRHQCAIHDTLTWGPWGPLVRFTLEHVGIGGLREDGLRATVIPNPAHGYVTVARDGDEGTIAITDVTGRVVMNERPVADGERVDVSALRAGIYFVTLTSPRGSTTVKLAVE